MLVWRGDDGCAPTPADGKYQACLLASMGRKEEGTHIWMYMVCKARRVNKIIIYMQVHIEYFFGTSIALLESGLGLPSTSPGGRS